MALVAPTRQPPAQAQQNIPTWDNLHSEVTSDDDASTTSDASSLHPPPIPKMVGNYYLNECLGSGYSGSIYKATNVMTRHTVAMKLQWIHHECPTNRYELHFYPRLRGGHGMPLLYASGVEGEYSYLGIQLLGPSLDSLFRQSGKTSWDLRTVCSIAVQLISRMKTMHDRGVLHRDIQLGNCAIGLPPEEKTIYMIDFGFSKCYIDDRTGRHIIDNGAPRDFIGNYWFSSVNVHCRGKVPSRRDDMEAVGLMLIHLLTPGGLSWTRNGVPKTELAHTRLKTAKRKATAEMLCRDLPVEFEDYLTYTRSLSFKQCPDYERWMDVFRDLARREGFGNVDEFIWPPPPIPKAVIPTNLNTPQRKTPANTFDDYMKVLQDLAKVDLNQHNILGDRTNAQPVIPILPPKLVKPQDSGVKSGDSSQPPPLYQERYAESEEGNSLPMRYQQSKAVVLAKLCREASAAVDNPTVARLITEFTSALQINSSRTLTREAIRFLDILVKKLGDPSVFVAPAREVKDAGYPEKQPAHVKLGVAARLRREVLAAPNNGVLAMMVEEFTRVTNRSTGRTITKDGFAFLDGVALRLKVLA